MFSNTNGIIKTTTRNAGDFRKTILKKNRITLIKDIVTHEIIASLSLQQLRFFVQWCSNIYIHLQEYLVKGPLPSFTLTSWFGTHQQPSAVILSGYLTSSLDFSWPWTVMDLVFKQNQEFSLGLFHLGPFQNFIISLHSKTRFDMCLGPLSWNTQLCANFNCLAVVEEFGDSPSTLFHPFCPVMTIMLPPLCWYSWCSLLKCESFTFLLLQRYLLSLWPIT